jgi:exonuclease SbcC
MKILKIRLANLNSLVGEWSLDFTARAFDSDSLFAITGPTGAGKSTILDAICLGLYGCTPRLEAITEGANDIMSKGTGSCFAEIIFSTTRGTFMARWSQRRARKSPAGKLQSPAHVMAEWPSGNILEERSSRVPPLVAGLTGLDFRRFTRSMLLAQGAFSAFLQAKPDERAPLLEQLTGTEVYSRASKAVHLQRCEIQSRVAHICAQMTEHTPLSEPDRMALEHSLGEASAALGRLSSRIQSTRSHLNRHARLGEALLQQSSAEQAVQELLVQQKDFEPTRTLLRQAEAASPIIPLVQLAKKAKHHLSTLLEHHAAVLSENDQICKQQQSLQDHLKQCQKHYTSCIQDLERLRPIIHHARTLEHTWEQKKLQEKAIEAELGALQVAAEQAAKALQRQAGQLNDAENVLLQQQCELKQHSKDEALAAQLSLIEDRYANFKRCLRLHAETQLNERRAQQDLNRMCKSASEAAEAIVTLDTKVSAINQERTSLTDTRAKLSYGLSAAAIRQELQSRSTQLAALQELERSLDAWQEACLFSMQLEEELTQTRKKIKEHENSAVAVEEKVASLHAIVTLLSEQQILADSVSTLAALRAQLVHGLECPLCGAVEHPYSRDHSPHKHLPVTEDLKHTLTCRKAELLAAQNEQAVIQERLKQDFANLARLTHAAGDASTRMSNLEHQCSSGAEQLLHIPVENKPRHTQEMDLNNDQRSSKLRTVYRKALSAEKEKIRIAEDQTTAQLQAVEALENQQSALQIELEATLGKRSTAQRALELIRSQQILAERMAARAEGESSSAQMEYEAAHTALRSAYEPHAHPAHPLDDEPSALTTFIEQLQLRARRWHQLQTGAEKQAETCRTMRTDLQITQAQLSRTREQIENQQAILSAHQHQRHATEIQLQTALSDLGSPSSDEAERQLIHSVEASRRSLDQATLALHETEMRLTRVKEAVGQIEKQLAFQRIEVQTLEDDVAEKCQQSGFSGIDHVCASAMDMLEMQALQKQEQLLEGQLIEARALLAAADQQVQLKRADVQGLAEKADLETQLSTLVLEEQQALEQTGRLKAEVVTQGLISKRHTELKHELEKEEAALLQMSTLHELIGSSDGKKFRNFAQTLTLRRMLSQANIQLQRMTDRYILIPDGQRALEIAIIDRYQADEVRTVRNLSGGESFIVSLALALGLSQMASENVRVESLFLDEGFGTLDPEALDIALDALSHLRLSGKQIGVISHVDALKDRIDLKISVNPVGGGRSVLSGPGCQRCPQQGVS